MLCNCCFITKEANLQILNVKLFKVEMKNMVNVPYN